MFQLDFNQSQRERVESNEVFDFDLQVFDNLPGIIFPHMNFHKWSKEAYLDFLGWWDWLVQRLAQIGYQRAMVMVRDDNPKLAKFLSMCGFEYTATIDGADGHPYDMYTMEMK